jgi:hypothetical protein
MTQYRVNSALGKVNPKRCASASYAGHRDVSAALLDDAVCGRQSESRCAPQKVDPTSRCSFFEPVFMVQPAENISRCYPAIAWQLMAMDAWAWLRPTVGIRNAWSQARVRSSLIVVGNPLPQDRPRMLLAQLTFPSPVIIAPLPLCRPFAAAAAAFSAVTRA